MANFAQILMEAKRKAQLTGRPLTQQETSGIAQGYAESSSERNVRAQTIANQEKEIAQREKLQATELQAAKERQAAELAQRKSEQQAQMAAAEAADKRAEKQQTVTSVAAGAAIGGYVAAGTAVGGPWGAVIGAVAGYAVSRSHLCTATKNETGLEKDHVETLKRFRNYVNECHRGPLEFYLEVGPEITRSISEKENDQKAFYEALKSDLIYPVIVHTDSCHHEQAYRLYRNFVGKLILRYTPHLFKRYRTIVASDNRNFRRAA